MYRVKTYNLKLPHSDFCKIMDARKITAAIWNFCIQESRQFYIDNDKKWITKTELQKRTKRQYPLHSQSIQAVVHKYIDAREGAKKARLKGFKKVRYPHKLKKSFVLPFGEDAIHTEGDIISFSFGIQNGKQSQPISIRLKNLPTGKIVKAEFNYDHCLQLKLTWQDGFEALRPQGRQYAAVDLGEIHTIASVCEDGSSLIITGRQLRAIHQLRNKRLAYLQRRIAKCTKGSRKYKRLQTAKRKLLVKSRGQMQTLLGQISNTYVDWCQEHAVSAVFIGNPNGVQNKTKKKKKAIRKVRQKLSQWAFGKVTGKLMSKLEIVGIASERVSEAYTSQTCPVCQKRKKPKGRMYKCSCGYHQHRDIHGAVNILSLASTGKIEDRQVVPVTKYLRTALCTAESSSRADRPWTLAV